MFLESSRGNNVIAHTATVNIIVSWEGELGVDLPNFFTYVWNRRTSSKIYL